MSKYSSLRDYLISSGRDVVLVSFSEIEHVIGEALPRSARVYRAWWSNHHHHVQARFGWLAAGYIVDWVDFEREVVKFVMSKEVSEFFSLSEEKGEDRNLSMAVHNAEEFEIFARKVMSEYFGLELKKRRRSDWPKEFDLVSPDFRIVGDAKYFKMVRGKRLPPAKFSNIAEYVWMLEKIDADIKFLVFGNDIRVPKKWLEKYGKYVDNVKFYFIHEDGRIEELL